MLESIHFKDYPVLFVDDEDFAIVTFKHLFKDELTIYTASHGHEALLMLAAHPEIALVVTDQRMPGMTGLELLTHMTKKYPKKIINILVTAYSDLTLVVEAFNKGNLFRYISKPYDEAFLKQTILQGIERYHLLAVWEDFYTTNKERVEKAKEDKR